MFILNHVRTYKFSLVGQYLCIKVQRIPSHFGFTFLKTVVPNSASSSLDPIVEYVCKDLHCGFTLLKTGFFSSASSSQSTEWQLSISIVNRQSQDETVSASSSSFDPIVQSGQLPISRLFSPVPPPTSLDPIVVQSEQARPTGCSTSQSNLSSAFLQRQTDSIVITK